MANPKNIFELTKRVQDLQAKMVAAQEALAQETVVGSAGGGAVKVTMSGDQRVKSLEIEAEVLANPDKEMLQDLLAAAVNDAISQAQELAKKRLGDITGGLQLPGM